MPLTPAQKKRCAALPTPEARAKCRKTLLARNAAKVAAANTSVTPKPAPAPTPAPTPTPTPPPAPVYTPPKPSGSYVRPYGPKAPWNVPVKGLKKHPESDKYIKLFWDGNNLATNKSINLSFDWYTYPVFYASDSTGSYQVVSKNPDWSNIHGKMVPWNPKWIPSVGSDAQIIVLDEAKGIEYNFWQVQFKDNKVYVSNGSVVGGDYRTKIDGWKSSRGVGIQYLAMLVRPEEIEQGVIEHALSVPIMNPSGQFYVAPATKLEHPNGKVGVPEGMRFALTATDSEIEAWVKTKPAKFQNFCRTVGRCMRDYGWIVSDTSGGAHFQFEDIKSAEAKWKALGIWPTVSADGKEYPRDLLDGLLTATNFYTIVPSDQY